MTGRLKIIVCLLLFKSLYKCLSQCKCKGYWKVSMVGNQHKVEWKCVIHVNIRVCVFESV